MLYSSTTKEQMTAWDTAAVSEFVVAGDTDALVLDRQPLEGLDAAVAAGRIGEYLAPVDRLRVGFEVRCGLRELRLKSRELSGDLIHLVDTFLDQFDLEEARLRIEITRTQSCPKFHCDNLNVRLVTTYLGPTTEYQYAGENKTHIASLGGLVFLKGHKHPTFGDTVHHRSPEVPAGERRLCVAIDY